MQNSKNNSVKTNSTFTKKSTTKGSAFSGDNNRYKENNTNTKATNKSTNKTANKSTNNTIKNTTTNTIKNKSTLNTNNKSDNSICPYMKKCGGCNYINIPYEEQLKLKEKAVRQLLGDVLKQQNTKLDAIIVADDPFYYRNKVHSVFDRDAHGKIIRGIYQEDSHKIVNVSNCLLEDKTADSIIEEIKKLLPSFKLKVYDEDSKTGFLRHVLVRVGSSEGKKQLMVVLVTSEVKFPSKNNFVKALTDKFPEICTIVQNINDKRTSMVLGERNIIVYGKGYIEDDTLGLKFRISPSAFYQINSIQTKKLYNLALDFAGLTGKETVLDTYCGTGTIGMFMASKSKQVIGVELNKDAVKDAISNAKGNKINNIFFVNDDATKYMQRLEAYTQSGDTEVPKIDVLCMDPPRSGSTSEFIQATARLKIPKIVYVSCGPDTLGRDLKEFIKLGYKVKRIVPVDMFPHTKHTEVVTLLMR